MAFHYTAEYAASPRQVLDILTDQDFLKAYADELQTSSHEAEVQEHDGVWSIHLHLVAPTDQIPSIFRGFVGSQIVIDDRREWTTDSEGGYRSTLEVKAEVNGRSASIRGSLLLTPSGSGTTFVADGVPTFSMPFIGGVVRDAIAELGEACFEDETKVLLRWLAPAIPPSDKNDAENAKHVS